jgi:ZIP family zinc transporter
LRFVAIGFHFRYDAPVLLACGLAVLAVTLGLLLGLTRSHVLVGPLRSFALAAALAVVITHLVPEALSEIGAWGLLLLAFTVAAPAWLRLFRSGHDHGRHGAHGALGAGYAGLMVHHVGDGLGLGAYTALPGGALAHFDVLLALVVHTVPLVAVVTFAFRSAEGSRSAVLRSAGLALASVVGVLASRLVPEEVSHRLSAWIAAAVAGLLLHVVTHDLARDLPRDGLGRAADWFGAALGIGVSMFGVVHDHAESGSEFGASLLAFALGAAPALLPALLVLLLLPFATGPLGRAASLGFGHARGFDGIVLAAVLAGVPFGVGYAAGVLVVTGVLLGPGRALVSSLDAEPPPTRAQVLSEQGPWLVTGVVLAAVLHAGIAPGALNAVPAVVALGVAVLVALPARIPPVAAVPLAASLLERGLFPAAALAFALLGPLPVLALLERLTHRRENARGIALAAALAIAASLIAGMGIRSHFSFAALLPREAAWVLLAACIVPLLGIAWSRGPRGFLASVFHSHDTA